MITTADKSSRCFVFSQSPDTASKRLTVTS
jgi:hypothetical protein